MRTLSLIIRPVMAFESHLMLSWLISSHHNKDTSNNVNFAFHYWLNDDRLSRVRARCHVSLMIIPKALPKVVLQPHLLLHFNRNYSTFANCYIKEINYYIHKQFIYTHTQPEIDIQASHVSSLMHFVPPTTLPFSSVKWVPKTSTNPTKSCNVGCADLQA